MNATAETSTSDLIVRGTAAEGLVRALAISATETVREAQRAHGLSPLATAALGRLLMASQVMGSLFKDSGERLSLMISATGSLGGLTAIAGSDGTVKGYAENPAAPCACPAPTAADVAAGLESGTLAVVHTSPHIEPFVSQIALVNGTISDDLIAYYIISEQIPTMVSLDVVLDENGQVKHAGGYFIQLMPGYDESAVDRLETNVNMAGSVSKQIADGMTGDEIIAMLFDGIEFEMFDEFDVEYRCNCERERYLRALVSLNEADYRELHDAGEPVETSCMFCGKKYKFEIPEIDSAREEAKRGNSSEEA